MNIRHDKFKLKVSEFNYLVNLKTDLIKVLISVQLIFNIFVFTYGILTGLNKYALISQIVMVVILGLIALAIKKNYSVKIITYLITIFYTLFIMPGIWLALGANHPFPVIMSIYTAILIIILLEGHARGVLLLIYLIISTVISLNDIIVISNNSNILSAINRSISLYLAFTLIALSVWIFKAKFILINKKLHNNSITDSLTGAYNWHMLSNYIYNFNESFAKVDGNYSIVMIDMDNFKQINDLYGHSAGDYALCEFAKYANKHIRREDLLVRYGGDEFIILFSNCDKEEAYKIMIKLLNETHKLKNLYSDINLSFSAGISDFKESLLLENDIIKIADKRMYSAKNNGKDSIVMTDEKSYKSIN